MDVTEIGQTLFKRDSSGKVRVWYYEIGTDGAHWAWRSNAGTRQGKMVISGWKFVEQKNLGKVNETSLKDQASLEAVAEFTKKKDRGYFDKIENIDQFEKIKPMLASKHENAKYDFEKNTYISQPKLDGIRCIARANGLWTRAGKEIVAVPHVALALEDFFKSYPNAILDGELYNHDLRDDFNTITSLVRKTKPTREDLDDSGRLVEYHIYDIIDSEPFTKRYSDFRILMQHRDPCIKLVSTQTVYNIGEMDNLYGEYLSDGYEGQMIRVDGPYEQDKRSKLLIKRKEFLDDEFKVLRVEEGIGNWAGCVKRFVLELPDGREFGSNVRGTQTVLAELLRSGQTPNWATCRYFTPTPDGIPRFPVVTDYGYGKRSD